MVGNGLESDEVYFKVDARPDQETMETTLCFGYRLYSIQGCKRVLYSLQLFDVSVVYIIEKGAAVVNRAFDYCFDNRYGGVPVKMFTNAPKLAHVDLGACGSCNSLR